LREAADSPDTLMFAGWAATYQTRCEQNH
jgi:hypothetical protein